MAKNNTEDKEGNRKVALVNINDDMLKAMASVYLINQGEGFGQVSKEAVRQKYLKIMGSDEAAKYVRDYLYSQEDSGRGLDRSVREIELTERGTKIIQESILALKVSDITNLMKAENPIKKDYQDRYVDSLNDEDKKNIISDYTTFLLMTYVSEATGDIRDPVRNIEKRFCEVKE